MLSGQGEEFVLLEVQSLRSRDLADVLRHSNEFVVAENQFQQGRELCNTLWQGGKLVVSVTVVVVMVVVAFVVFVIVAAVVGNCHYCCWQPTPIFAGT